MDNPERFKSEPGDPEKQSRIDGFFEEVLELLGYDEDTIRAFCEIRSREVAAEGKGSSSSPDLTDDRLTELIVKGRTVAMALEIRDDLNYVQLYLTHFLTPELITEIT